MKKPIRNYLITAGVAVVLSVIVLIIEFVCGNAAGNIRRMISDACFLSGAFLMAAWVLSLIANGVLFYPFEYLGSRICCKITENRDRRMSFTDYAAAQKKKGKPNFYHLFITGAVFVLISVIVSMLA